MLQECDGSSNRVCVVPVRIEATVVRVSQGGENVWNLHRNEDTFSCNAAVIATPGSITSCAGSGVVRRNRLRFLAGCHKR